jgi:hypothetical protein
MEDSEVETIIDLPTPTTGAGTPTPSAGSGAPQDKGRVLVEVYYCHDQLLNLPILSQLLANPVPLHAYVFMPAPAVAPTATALP